VPESPSSRPRLRKLRLSRAWGCAAPWLALTQAAAQASKTVAYAMIGLMMNHPQFRREFEAAKAETRQALGFTGL
jgi:hypothetical protein